MAWRLAETADAASVQHTRTRNSNLQSGTLQGGDATFEAENAHSDPGRHTPYAQRWRCVRVREQVVSSAPVAIDFPDAHAAVPRGGGHV
eukprot:3295459-Pleurochrysis_carterae.AAC.2